VVGTSGTSDERFGDGVAIARTAPARICGATVGVPESMKVSRPPIMSLIAAASPR
jgi:hypothetical protein